MCSGERWLAVGRSCLRRPAACASQGLRAARDNWGLLVASLGSGASGAPRPEWFSERVLWGWAVEANSHGQTFFEMVPKVRWKRKRKPILYVSIVILGVLEFGVFLQGFLASLGLMDCSFLNRH